MGDALMVIPIIGLVSLLAVFTVLIVDQDEAVPGVADGDLPIWAVAVFTLVQQAALLLWPAIVSRWKGLGLATDWGLSFKLEDLGIGLGVAMIAMFSAGLVATVTSLIVGLEDDADGENLEILTSAEGTPWLIVLIYTVVVVAPVAEEVFFRGLLLRSVKNRWGSVVAVVVSVLAFAPLHLADGGFLSSGQIVLVAAISTLGLAFAITAEVTGRLGASIIAHVIVNAIGAGAALGYFDRFVDALPT